MRLEAKEMNETFNERYISTKEVIQLACLHGILILILISFYTISLMCLLLDMYKLQGSFTNIDIAMYVSRSSGLTKERPSQ